MARAIDHRLSQRDIALDPCGYFLIALDVEQGEIVATLFGNTIDDAGRACDPKTGEPIPCDRPYE